MGLALVHGIIQKACGQLDIESEPGRGTTIILTLPIAKAEAAAAESTRREVPINPRLPRSMKTTSTISGPAFSAWEYV